MDRWVGVLAGLSLSIIGMTATARADAPAGNRTPDRPDVPQPETDFNAPWLKWDRATGNWWGQRATLGDHGIDFNAALTADYSRNFHGGIDTADDALRHLLDVNLTFDLQKLIGMKGGTFYANFQNESGESGTTELTGDFQGFDNIDAAGLTQLSEIWYEQICLNDKLRIKLGKIDAASEFAVPATAKAFLNNSFGGSPNIPMPTYPDPSFGALVAWNATDQFGLAFGAQDGSGQEGIRTGSIGPATLFGKPSDLFMIAEARISWTCDNGSMPGRLAVGGWRHTGRFDRLDGNGTEAGANGVYTLAEQCVWRVDPQTADDSRGISIFGQYAYADPSVSPAAHHVGLGAVWMGPIQWRPKDSAGLAATGVWFSNQSGISEDHELAIESFYEIQVMPFISVKPDLQYIMNPSGAAAAKDALVGTLRVTISF
jgi:porin